MADSDSNPTEAPGATASGGLSAIRSGRSLPQRVVISAGHGNLFFLSTALAANRAGLLARYITSIYTRPLQRRLLASRFVQRLIGQTLARKLLGHHRPELDTASITVLTSAELVARLLKRALPVLHLGLRRYPDFAFRAPMVLYGYLSARHVSECDILHVRSGYGRYAMARARRAGALCLVDHSIADSDYLFAVYEEESRRWSGGRVTTPLTRAAFNHINQDLLEADHILVNSDFVKSTLVSAKRARPEQISVLYLGVDTNIFTPGDLNAEPDTDNPFTILYLGTIDYRKGALYLLEACRRLRLPNCRVILLGPVGDVPLERYLGEFEHVPGVAFSDLASWYRRASVFVFPSLAEGSARVNFEAMACGIPVITTYEAGSPVRDGVEGFIVRARDSDALADRIVRLHADPTLRHQMGRAARARMETQFTWEHYSRGLIGLYERLAAGSEDLERRRTRVSR